MTAGFWWGMAAVPAGVALVALAGLVVFLALRSWARLDGRDTRIGWKRYGNPDGAASVVANSRSVRRIVFYPGYWILFVRGAESGFDAEHRRMASLIREQMDKDAKERCQC